MGVDHTESGLLADRAHPAVCSTPIETMTVPATEDGSLRALTDRQVEGSGCSRYERDDGWLVAFPEDPKGPVTVGEGKVLDISAACLADPGIPSPPWPVGLSPLPAFAVGLVVFALAVPANAEQDSLAACDRPGSGGRGGLCLATGSVV